MWAGEPDRSCGRVSPPGHAGGSAPRVTLGRPYGSGRPSRLVSAADAARTLKPQRRILLASVNLAPGLVAVLCRATPMSMLVPLRASNSRQSPAALVTRVLMPPAPA